MPYYISADGCRRFVTDVVARLWHEWAIVHPAWHAVVPQVVAAAIACNNPVAADGAGGAGRPRVLADRPAAARDRPVQRLSTAPIASTGPLTTEGEDFGAGSSLPFYAGGFPSPGPGGGYSGRGSPPGGLVLAGAPFPTIAGPAIGVSAPINLIGPTSSPGVPPSLIPTGPPLVDQVVVQIVPGTPPAQDVPEPGSLALVATLLGGGVLLRLVIRHQKSTRR